MCKHKQGLNRVLDIPLLSRPGDVSMVSFSNGPPSDQRSDTSRTLCTEVFSLN